MINNAIECRSHNQTSYLYLYDEMLWRKCEKGKITPFEDVI